MNPSLPSSDSHNVLYGSQNVRLQQKNTTKFYVHCILHNMHFTTVTMKMV